MFSLLPTANLVLVEEVIRGVISRGWVIDLLYYNETADNIMYYLVAILFSVGWIQGAIIRNFDSSKSPISNKYLNHGINVPTQKYSKFSAINSLNHKMLFLVRAYFTSTDKEQDKYNTQESNVHKDGINPLVYVNAYSM